MDYIVQTGLGQARNGNDPPKLPDDLINRPQWVFWRYVERDGKPTKVPYDPHIRRKADTTKPETWGTFEQALIANNKRGGDGIGFVITEDDTLSGVDLDDCIDAEGNIHPDAQAIIDDLNSYTEVSPSGTGVKVFLHGEKPGTDCDTQDTPWAGKIEMYDHSRFFTVTGEHLDGTPETICERPESFRALYKRFFGAVAAKPTTDAVPPSGLSYDQVLDHLRSDQFADEFERLCKGDTSRHAGDESRVDAALAYQIAYYAGGDVDLIERIMREHGPYREKWDKHKTYLRELTIVGAIDARAKKGTWYEPNPSEIVSIHPITPHEQKRNESTSEGDTKSVSVHGRGVNGQKRKLEKLLFKSPQEIIAEGGEQPEWVTYGFFARGWLTDLVGPAKKSGKTTFILHAIRCILDGRPFLGYDTKPTRVVYLTEQASSLVEALKKAGLDKPDEGLKILQWKDARDRSWPKLIEEVFEYAVGFGAGLVVVDTLNRFAGLKGEDENQAGAVSEVMGVLMTAAQEHNIAVLSIRHANKEGRARGSTQYDHDVDALFELKRPDGNMGDNVRVLEGIGRSDDIIGKLTIELGPDGYRNLGDDDTVRFKMAVRAVRETVSRNPEDPTPKTDLEKALQDEHNVALTTARRAIKWLYDQDDLVRTGEGKRGSPYMYYMPTITVKAA